MGADIGPVGELTVYSPSVNGGNCDLPWSFYSDLPVNKYFAAIPKTWDANDRYEKGGNCGRCIRVRCSCSQKKAYAQGACAKGGDIIVMVTDSCPSCPHKGDIDLSYSAWDDVSGNEGHSRYDGSWEFIPCPDNYLSGNTKLYLK